MSSVPNLTNKILIVTVLLVLLPVETLAFGAGDIPDFAYLNDKAFRHGDIENVLEELVKNAGGVALGGGLMKIASSVLHQVTGGSKFSKSDVKKVYFGNWLRDYSQAMDIAGLSKLTADTLILVVAVLGFMTFSFTTKEFEVTADRLGVYLPVEHIDNPKGYAEREGDARRFHPKLRPPVQARELEIDERNGMKKHMATENQGWDTSTAFIRRTFRSCIEHGRRALGNEGADLWEAYRLLGTGLHTMEDLLAHSNWCEIALRKMGHKDVFCHVGDNVIINTPNGRAPPLVTSTFGSADFMHSLLGEAGDKLSQASVTDLSAKLDNVAQSAKKAPDLSILKGIFGKFGGGDSQKLDQGNEMQQQAQAYEFNPDNIAPPVVKERLLQVLGWHDDVMRDITKKIEMVPGLSHLLEEFSNTLNEYIYTVIAPYVVPLLTAATSALDEGSKLVIDNDDQYEVFNNPNAHDPSHSLLSKDHFGLILNEPAGKFAKVVVQHSVNLIVHAWSDNGNPDDVINRILEAFHHPYYASGRSEVQKKMFDEMQKWLGGLGGESREVIQSLTKDAVRDHRNKRKGLEDTTEPGYGDSSGYSRLNFNTKVSGNVGDGCGYSALNNQGSHSQYGRQSGGYSQTGSGGQCRNDDGNQSYGKIPGDSSRRQNDDNALSYGSDSQRHDDAPYGQRRDNSAVYSANTGYSSQRHDDSPSYGGSNTGYGGQRRDDSNAYGGNNTGYSNQRRQDTPSYGSNAGYGGQRCEDATYGGSKTGSGGQRRDDTPSYGDSNTGYGGQRRDNFTAYGGNNTGYSTQRPDDTPSSGDGQRDESSYGGGFSMGGVGDQGRDDNYGGNRHRNDDETPRFGSGGRMEQRHGGQGKPYAPSYSQPEHSSHGKQDDTDDDRRGGHHQKYGRKDDDSDDMKTKYHSGGDDDKQHGKYRQQGGSSGYAPSYGGNDDTYGVECLNIGGGRDDDRKRLHKHHQGDY